MRVQTCQLKVHKSFRIAIPIPIAAKHSASVGEVVSEVDPDSQAPVDSGAWGGLQQLTENERCDSSEEVGRASIILSSCRMLSDSRFKQFRGDSIM